MTTASLVGCEVPRLSTPPARDLTPETSRGFECIEFAEDVLGLTLMPWQRWTLLHLLELAADGSFRFRTGLVITSRQAGKSTLLQVLALWRMYVDGAPLVLGSAQNLALAEETWTGALQMAESVPELAREVSQVSKTNGDKHFRLTTGERYKVAAATRSGSRGLSSDLVLLDELGEHRDYEAWGASTKTTLARPSPQALCFSNAGDKTSVVLHDLRERALAAAADRTTRVGIFEWSAPDGCELDDRQAWAMANPALGHRMTEDAIAASLAVDPEPVFRTEILCQWVQAVEAAISPTVWASLADPDAPRGTDVTFALDVAPDHSAASIAVAWQRPDGAAQVMLAHTQQGVDGVVERAASLLSSWGGRLLVEQGGTASFLLSQLQAAHVPIETVSRRFYVEACAALDAAVTARKVRHGNGDDLNAAVAAARWSSHGDSGTAGAVPQGPAGVRPGRGGPGTARADPAEAVVGRMDGGGVTVDLDLVPVPPSALAELARAVAALPPLGDWVRDAACGELDPEVWTADSPDADELALAERVCRRCPVRQECADYAAQTPVWGIWAGVWHGRTGKRQSAA